MPYSCVTGGSYRQRSVTTFVQVGVGRNVAVDLQVPLVVASFEDDIGRTAVRGLGDVRLGVRWGKAEGPWAWALTAHAKAPTGPADFQDRDVPLGDGQWDITPGVRVGRSLHPFGWVEMWHGYTVRLRNPTTGIDRGDEWRPVIALGVTPIQEAGVLLRGEAILSGRDRDAFGLRPPGRRLLQARLAAFARPVPAAWIEVGAAIPIAGRRWPATVVPYLSVMWAFGIG